MKKVLSLVVTLGLLVFNISPVFAQLGDVTPPPAPVEPAPVVQAILPPADTTGPVISGVANLSLALHDATILWLTDELSISTFEYGLTLSYGASATLPASAALGGTAVLTGLTSGTTYYYCIHATDLSGNASSLCNQSLTTTSDAVVLDTTPPNITLVTVAPVSTTGATINFTTDEVGNARVEYGTTLGYGNTAALDTNLALTHAVVLSNLTPNTLYHYRIISGDELGNETITSDETFTTGALPSVEVAVTPSTSPVAVISAVDTASVSTSTATITWHTDLASDSQIEYGTSESFGSLTNLNSTLTTNHSVTLAGLSANTNYVFRVKSKPLGATLATLSTNHEFNTLNNSIPVVAPANILAVSSGSIGNTSATITWNTDKAATSQVQYGLNTAYDFSTTESTTLTTSHSVSLSNLSLGTTYHFRVKSTDEVGNETFSEDYTLTTTGLAVSVLPPVPVVNTSTSTSPETPLVEVSGVDSEIVFEIPSDNDSNNPLNEVVEIIRNENEYPTSPSDGQVVYEGSNETFTDTHLTNGETYFYSVYSLGAGGSLSKPIHVALAPISGVREVKFNESGTLASSTPLLHFVKTFQKGSTDIEVEHLQEILSVDGDSYPEKYITGYFGSLTEAALKRFQAKHGLSQTGVVDTTTQKELNAVSLSETKLNIPTDLAAFEKDLKLGDQGSAVKGLQQYLTYEGSYDEALVSGYFGSLTEKAVKTFQSKHKIEPVSGYVGSKTRHKMQQLVGL